MNPQKNEEPRKSQELIMEKQKKWYNAIIATSEGGRMYVFDPTEVDGYIDATDECISVIFHSGVCVWLKRDVPQELYPGEDLCTLLDAVMSDRGGETTVFGTDWKGDRVTLDGSQVASFSTGEKGDSCAVMLRSGHKIMLSIEISSEVYSEDDLQGLLLNIMYLGRSESDGDDVPPVAPGSGVN